VPVLAAAAFAGAVLVPTNAAVPQVLKVAQAQASPADCYTVASRTLAVTRGNLPAAIGAIRASGGCGDSIANGLCSASTSGGEAGPGPPSGSSRVVATAPVEG